MQSAYAFVEEEWEGEPTRPDLEPIKALPQDRTSRARRLLARARDRRLDLADAILGRAPGCGGVIETSLRVRRYDQLVRLERNLRSVLGER